MFSQQLDTTWILPLPDILCTTIHFKENPLGRRWHISACVKCGWDWYILKKNANQGIYHQEKILLRGYQTPKITWHFYYDEMLRKTWSITKPLFMFHAEKSHGYKRLCKVCIICDLTTAAKPHNSEGDKDKKKKITPAAP